MTPRSLQTVFRSLAEGSAVDDGELLRLFLAGDEHAFADLVRRHGRLVWSACRSLTRSECEADDAFQTTFVVLLKNARKVKAPARLSSWLYGVAYKVCANARKAAARRAARERRVAAAEGNGHTVPGAAWDRALAAVHEEVPQLPESLRVPFVLCCLEGVPPVEAARRLGWNPSTLSVRLSRAKDALLARLDARGLTLGAVAGLGLVGPPTSAVAKAAALAHAGAVVPASLLTLSHGVVGMSVNPVKALAAAVLVAVGVGGTVGSGWMAPAGAQVPGGPPATKAPPADPTAELRAQRDQIEELRRRLDVTTARLEEVTKAEAAARHRAERAGALAQSPWAAAERLKFDQLASTTGQFRTVRHHYFLVPANGLNFDMLQKVVSVYEAKGWEFAGTVPMNETLSCVIRRATAPPPPSPVATPPAPTRLKPEAPTAVPAPGAGRAVPPPASPPASIPGGAGEAPAGQLPRSADGYLPPEVAPGSDTLPQAVIPSPTFPPARPRSADDLPPPRPDVPATKPIAPPSPEPTRPNEEVLPPAGVEQTSEPLAPVTPADTPPTPSAPALPPSLDHLTPAAKQELPKPNPGADYIPALPPPTPESIEAEIARLQTLLANIRPAKAIPSTWRWCSTGRVPSSTRTPWPSC